MLGVSLTVLLLSAVGGPLAHAVRLARRRRKPGGSSDGPAPAGAFGAAAEAGRTAHRRPVRGPRLAGLPTWITAALVTASAGSLVAMFADFDANQAEFFLGGPRRTRLPEWAAAYDLVG
ncbi:hypothetical protein ABT158_45155 [Nonomuraea sp. NPDC001636]|uniref:hypothetical protein n=1 Tax=Nonomuraea sp. NPDC001636 TaxID=3154391 RepID=UPI00331B9D94